MRHASPPRRYGRRAVIGVIAVLCAPVLLPTVQAQGEVPMEDLRSANIQRIGSLRTPVVSDMAFWGDLAVVNTGLFDAGTADDGFLVIDISDPSAPTEVGRFRCADATNDVSIWGSLVILSAERATSCGTAGSGGQIVIADITDPHAPSLVATVPIRWSSSHTHTLLPDLKHRDGRGKPFPRLLVYSNNNAASIVEVPIEHPETAREVAGYGIKTINPILVGDLNPDTVTAEYCHDLTFFVPRRLAACAGSDDTHLWDVGNPTAPRPLSRIDIPFAEHVHSTAFSNDGRTLVIGDERVTAGPLANCAGGTGAPLGALWFYDISDPAAPAYRGMFQIPQIAPGRYCSAHYFNVVPNEGDRDVLIAAWYGAGTTVVDFTDPTSPSQIGYFLGHPLSGPGGSIAYSSYWYDGHIYVSNTADAVPLEERHSRRGFEILRLDTPNLRVARGLRFLNPQTQM